MFAVDAFTFESSKVKKAPRTFQASIELPGAIQPRGADPKGGGHMAMDGR